MRTLDRVVDEVTQLAQKATTKDEAITTLKHGMAKVINRLRYEIDVAREARDVYKAQRDSLREDVSALKSACRCGAGSAIPDPVPLNVGGGGSFRSSAPPSKPASSIKKALPIVPTVASPPPLSTSPRGGPPMRSPFSSVTSAPMGVAAPPTHGAPPNFAQSAPPAPPPQNPNQQYLALDDISMPHLAEYDHVPPYANDFAQNQQRSLVSPRDGDYRPLPPQAGQAMAMAGTARAQYVPVTLSRGSSADGAKNKFG